MVFFLYLVLLLLHRIGYFLAYVAESLVAIFFLDFKHLWLSGFSVRFKFARSQIRIPCVADILLIRGLFLLFLKSLDRAASWSCAFWLRLKLM